MYTIHLYNLRFVPVCNLFSGEQFGKLFSSKAQKMGDIDLNVEVVQKTKRFKVC